MQRLYDDLFYSKAVNELFTDQSFIKYMLRFQSALANAQAAQGLIPAEAAKVIEACCKTGIVDTGKLTGPVALGGNVNIPFVKQLTQAVADKDAEAARFVHFGATSQDVIDTATMLQLKDALASIAGDLDQLITQLAGLVVIHRDTLMIGRSFLQHARPITFGFKVACWLDALIRSRNQLAELREHTLALQLGGAVGTLSSMGKVGIKVSESMARILGLNASPISWHSSRDRFVRVATTLGVLQGTLGKLAEDIILLMQTEVAEVFEPSLAGKGGSSSMPHKRNPVSSIAIVSNSKRVPGLVSTMLNCMAGDHERSSGHWHAEWETLASIVMLAAGSTKQATVVTNGLEVDTIQMLRNLEVTRGLIYAENLSNALARHIGKSDAETIVEDACAKAKKQRRHLKEVVADNHVVSKYLSQDQLEEMFDPAHSIGLCGEYIDRVLKLI